jgi:hypothetical protein
MLWLTDHVIPAQEHFTSNIIRQKLSVAIDELPLPTEGDKRVLLFTPEKEQHEIPLQFIHYNLRKNRNRVVSFGCNIKLLDLKSYAEGQSFTHVFFHLVTNLTNLNPDDYLENLSKAFPDKQIMMSGSQAQQVSKLPNNVRLIKSIEDLLKFVKE